MRIDTTEWKTKVLFNYRGNFRNW